MRIILRVYKEVRMGNLSTMIIDNTLNIKVSCEKSEETSA